MRHLKELAEGELLNSNHEVKVVKLTLRRKGLRFCRFGQKRSPILRQVLQPAQPDRLAAQEWFGEARADRPTPVAIAVADLVEERRRRSPAFDELGMITGDGLHLLLVLPGDVEHERRLRV